MTVYEWLKTLDSQDLALILTELKDGKYNYGNLDMNFTIRFHTILPCLNERNDIKEWLTYSVEMEEMEEMDKMDKVINDFIVNDICWCIDSDKCKNKECFRHMSNMPVGGVFTASHLMWTELCPLRKESEV